MTDSTPDINIAVNVPTAAGTQPPAPAESGDAAKAALDAATNTFLPSQEPQDAPTAAAVVVPAPEPAADGSGDS